MDTSNHHIAHYRKALEKFVTFTNEEWALFAHGLRFKCLNKKQCFIQAGEISKAVGFVISGSVRLYHIKDGEQITGYFCLEDDWVSAYKSFITQQPSNVYIEALEDTRLLTFSYQHLQQCYQSPQLCYKAERFGRLIAEYLVCCYDDRVNSFVTESPEERYLKMLATGKNIMQRIPQHYIANYLGITPVSLSRIRKRIMETV
ncbi:Crp/Fnr family transcriptional regulator [Mucilaginibacter koreensis]